MTKYTVTLTRYHKVAQRWEDEFDTTSQKQWEQLIKSIEDIQKEGNKPFPKQAPTDVAEWKRAYWLLDTTNWKSTPEEENVFTFEDEEEVTVKEVKE